MDGSMRLPTIERKLRAGAYGDPAILPFETWDALYMGGATGGTGYSHYWRECDQRHRKYLQASCDSIEEGAIATAMGWKTYRIDLEKLGPQAGEILCPEFLDKTVTCERCGLCTGARLDSKNIVIPAINDSSRCYVVVAQAPSSIWHALDRGNIPTVEPDYLGRYLAGLTPNDRLTSAVFWRGPSAIDGAPVVAIASGLSPVPSDQSDNDKTGPMVQTWILREDMAPIMALRGADRSICGDCVHRPVNFA